MRALFKHELYKLFTSVGFRVILIFISVFTVWAALFAASQYYDRTDNIKNLYLLDSLGHYMDDVNLNGISLYNQWLGGKSGNEFFATVFYFFLPLIITIPYGLSFIKEQKSGYMRNVITRKGKLRYYGAKYMATFFSGFSLTFFALLLNVLIVAAFIPAFKPDPFEWLMYAVYPEKPFSSLYYNYPVIYMFIYMVMEALFAGLLVTVSMVITFFVKNVYTALFGPFLFLLFFRNLMELLLFDVHLGTSPFTIFRGAHADIPPTLWVIFIYIVGVFAVTAGFTFWRGRTKDVF